MRQLESNHSGGLLDRSLALTLEVLLDLGVLAQTLQIAMVRLAEELHFLFGLAQLLVGRLVFTVLRGNVLERQRFLVDDTVRTGQTEFVQQRTVQLGGWCHNYSRETDSSCLVINSVAPLE